MKKYFFSIFLLISTVHAQTEEVSEVFEPSEEKIIPVITTEVFVELGSKAFFSGTDSTLFDEYPQAVYKWDMGDGTHPKWGQEIGHMYEKPGTYKVLLEIKQGENQSEIFQDIVVFEKQGVLVLDSNEMKDSLVSQAAHYGILLKAIVSEETKTGFSAEEELIRKVQENIQAFKDADMIIFYTESVTQLQAFSQFWQKLSEENKFNLKEKMWVQILDTSLLKAAKLIQPIFSLLKPHFILLTRSEALSPLFRDEGVEKLRRRAIEYRIIDERTATSEWLPLSRLMTYFAVSGISQNIIYLLLAVPFIAFTIAFFRQFIGIFTLGVYAPLMLTVSFLMLGFYFGLIVFLVVMLVSYLIRLLFEKVELLYIPRVSLLLSALALSFFLVLAVAVYVDVSTNLALTIFPMLVMASLSEKFLSAQSSGGMKYAFISTGETMLVSFVSYFLVTWGWLESAILSAPEIIVLPILGIIWLGKFTGLRLSEYVKFRTLFQEDAQE